MTQVWKVSISLSGKTVFLVHTLWTMEDVVGSEDFGCSSVSLLKYCWHSQQFYFFLAHAIFFFWKQSFVSILFILPGPYSPWKIVLEYCFSHVHTYYSVPTQGMDKLHIWVSILDISEDLSSCYLDFWSVKVQW